MIAVNSEKLGLSTKEFADRCSLPIDLIDYIREPGRTEELLVERCANALGMKIAVFKGEELPEPTFQEKHAAAVSSARFPRIRKYLLDRERCLQPEKAIALFAEDKVSIAERNLILHLSTEALYRFCDTDSSHFRFEEYLFKLHTPLFSRFEREVTKLPIPEEEKKDRIDTARNSIFACDTLENIAIRVVEPFADELEEKLEQNRFEFIEDFESPLLWDCDEELMKIKILDEKRQTRTEIKLLTVKEREKANNK